MPSPSQGKPNQQYSSSTALRPKTISKRSHSTSDSVPGTSSLTPIWALASVMIMDHPIRSTGTSTTPSNATTKNANKSGKPPIDTSTARGFNSNSGGATNSGMYNGSGPAGNANRIPPIIERTESSGPITGSFSSGIQRSLYSSSNAEFKAAASGSSAVGEWGKLSQTESRGVISFESNKDKRTAERKGANQNSSIVRSNRKRDDAPDTLNNSPKAGLENKFGGIAIGGGFGSSSQIERPHLPLHAYANSYLKSSNRGNDNAAGGISISNPLLGNGSRRIDGRMSIPKGPPMSQSTLSMMPSWRRNVPSANNVSNKVHPTAVSSYGTTNFSKFNKSDAASVISSAYGGSSFTNLYRRRRKLSITPDGFPYIPSLHLKKSSSSRGGGGGDGSMSGAGVSAGNGVSSSISGLGEASRFQSSYLLRGKAHGATMSSAVNDQEAEDDYFDDDRRHFPHLKSTSEWKGPSRQSGAKIKTQPQTPPSLFSSFSLDGTDDGYDSASNRIERLREWKRQQYLHSSNLEKSLEKGTEDTATNQPSSLQDFNDNITRQNISDLRNNAHHSPRNSVDQINFEGQDSLLIEQNLHSRIGEKTSATSGFFPVTSPSRGKKSRRRHSDSSTASTKQGNAYNTTIDKEEKHIMSSPSSSNFSNESMKRNTNDSQNEVADDDNILGNVYHAANFLFRLSPPLSPRAKIPELSLDEICKPMIEHESNDAPLSTKGNINPSESAPSTKRNRPPTHLHLSRPRFEKRFERSTSSATEDLDSSNCSLNPHDKKYTSVMSDKENTVFTFGSVSAWENCLYVRAEGARSGRVYLTNSHLIFIYEDDVAEDILYAQGWDHGIIDNYLMECPSLKATPIDIPLDASGEGGGVELIGTHNKSVTKKEKELLRFESKFIEMLECGFEDVNPVETKSEHELGNQDNNCRTEDVEKSSKYRSELESCPTIDSSDVSNLTVRGKLSNHRKRQQVNTHIETLGQFHHDCQSPASTTSRNTSETNIYSHESESLVEESYEEVMNKCIIRAIKEEARRRLQELDDEEESAAKMSTAASYSAWDKLDPETTEYDYESVYGHQTNISSFSECEFEIDFDAERMKYITGEDEQTKRDFIGIKWQLSKLGEIFPRRYMLKDVALEIFGPPLSSSVEKTNAIDDIDIPIGRLSKSSLLLVIPDAEETDEKGRLFNRFGKKKAKPRRDTFLHMLKDNAPNLDLSFWCKYSFDSSGRRAWTPSAFFRKQGSQTDPLNTLTEAWRAGSVSNFDYLLRLNAIAGRSVHDPGNYPIMPWVLSNYTSQSVPDLSDSRNFRDLSKPMGALDPERLKKFVERYDTLCAGWGDSAIPPFMYGSHYSNTGGVVLHYLVRLRPFAGLHRQLQVRRFSSTIFQVKKVINISVLYRGKGWSI